MVDPLDSLKPLAWIGSSLRDYRAFPDPVKDDMGYALYLAQRGGRHGTAKPLQGFGGAGVLELVERHDGDTYRAVYSVRFTNAIYVLHAFQKKSKRGRETPKSEMEVVRRRLRAAEEDARTGHGGTP
jgi:phage-related protein